MKTETKPIVVVIQGGTVEEVKNVPAGLEVHIVDLDVSGVDEEMLKPSPLDGQPCLLTKLGPYETE